MWIVENIHSNIFYLVQLQHQQLKVIEHASLSSVLQNMGMVLVFYTEQTDSVTEMYQYITCIVNVTYRALSVIYAGEYDSVLATIY